MVKNNKVEIKFDWNYVFNNNQAVLQIYQRVLSFSLRIKMKEFFYNLNLIFSSSESIICEI
jgi:hypothetical protein